MRPTWVCLDSRYACRSATHRISAVPGRRWSCADKRLFEKYLPAGSKVEFTSSLDTSKIAAGLNPAACRSAISTMSRPRAHRHEARGAARGRGGRVGRSVQRAAGSCRCSADFQPGRSARLAWRARRSRRPRTAAWAASRPARRAAAPARGGLDRNIEVTTAAMRSGESTRPSCPSRAHRRLIREGVAKRVAAGPSLDQRDRCLRRHALGPDRAPAGRPAGMAACRTRCPALSGRSAQCQRGGRNGRGTDLRLQSRPICGRASMASTPR